MGAALKHVGQVWRLLVLIGRFWCPVLSKTGHELLVCGHAKDTFLDT